MSPAPPEYREGTASREAIHAHLRACSANHRPALEARVDLLEYAGKMADNAVTFEAWSGGELVGLVAAYLNDAAGRTGYITNVSVTRAFMGRGVAARLMARCLERAAAEGLWTLALEVGRENAEAIALYRKVGFEQSGAKPESIFMELPLAREGNGKNGNA